MWKRGNSALNLWLHVHLFVIELSLPADKLIFFLLLLAHIWSHVDFSLLIFFSPSRAISIEKSCQYLLVLLFCDIFETCAISMCSTSSNDMLFFLYCVRSMQSLSWKHWYILTYSLIVIHVRNAFETKSNQLLIKLLWNWMKKLRWHCDSNKPFNGKMKWKICANYCD